MLCRNSLLVGLAVVVLGLPLGATAARAEDPAVEKELKALYGTWKYTKKISDVTVEGEVTLGKDGTMSWHDGALFDAVGGAAVAEGTFTIDPTKNPRTLDLVVKTPEGKEKKIQFIYELKGKELKLAVASDAASDDAEKKRPRDFKGKDVQVQVFKRTE
jgi:uncharacterized protein (TIGR03067 family)